MTDRYPIQMHSDEPNSYVIVIMFLLGVVVLELYSHPGHNKRTDQRSALVPKRISIIDSNQTTWQTTNLTLGVQRIVSLKTRM